MKIEKNCLTGKRDCDIISELPLKSGRRKTVPCKLNNGRQKKHRKRVLVLLGKPSEQKKVTELDEKSNRAGRKSNRVSLTAKQRKVLDFCDEMPRTTQEILEMVGVKYQTKTVRQYTTKLVMMGMLRPTTTASHDPNRKYITTHGEQED